jgi:hypothetical protein
MSKRGASARSPEIFLNPGIIVIHQLFQRAHDVCLSTSTAMRSQIATRLSRSWVTMKTVRFRLARSDFDQLVELRAR